jgi:hypothetical protein
MKLAALAFALLFPGSVLGASDAVPAPEGWRHETFEFPLPFAPSIGFEGHEHVRFAPGWGSFASERGFTYVFLWDVKDVAGPSQTVYGLEFALRVYFDGLMDTVAKARKLDLQETPAVVDLHPMKDVPGWVEAHAGSIHTWNGFSKGEPLTLQVEVTKRPCPGGRVQIFYALSKTPRTGGVWEELRRIREGVACS